MDADEYQRRARRTAIYPDQHKIIYPVVGMANEAGEALGRVKKHLRGDFSLTQEHGDLLENGTQREALVAELGDVLWYVAMAAHDLNINLNYLMNKNLQKLAKRAGDGTLRGDGDDR